MSYCLVGDIEEKSKKESGPEYDDIISFRPELRNPFQHEMPRLGICCSPALHSINRERPRILYSQRDNMWALLRSRSRSNCRLLCS